MDGQPPNSVFQRPQNINQPSIYGSRKKVWPFYAIGFIFIFGPILGLNALLSHILGIVLNNPATHTTGRALINIVVFSCWALSTIIGIVLAIIGTARAAKNTKNFGSNQS